MRDLIDRDRLKERLFPAVPDPRGVSKTETSLYMQGWNDAITSIIQNEPSAEPGWIPVTERLPENLEVVNITYINREPMTYYHIKGKPMVATAVYYYKRFYWYSVACVDVLGEYGTDEWDEMEDRIEVTAWMPLPECYRGESDGE